MIWEVRKGRECDTALNFALQSIEAKNVLIHEQGKLIELRGKRIENYALLDANWSERLTNQSDMFALHKEKQKRKLKKARKIAIVEGGVIVALLAILLL